MATQSHPISHHGGAPKVHRCSKEHTQQSLLDYWTQQRRDAALATPRLSSARAQDVAKGKADIIRPLGPAGSTPASAPAADHHHQLHQQGHGADGGQTQGVPKSDGGGVVQPAIARRVPNPLAYPYSTVGLLFYTQGDQDFYETGCMISRNIVLTAGSCVYRGGWSSHVAFYPGYNVRQASDPLHMFASASLCCEVAWTSSSQSPGLDDQYNFGMVWLDAAPGVELGWVGLVWDLPTAGRTWEAVGYPRSPNPPFTGQVMESSISTLSPSLGTPNTFGLAGDNMQDGSVGAPWLTTWQAATRDHVNGLSVRGYMDVPNVSFSPVFNANINAVFQWFAEPANHF